MLAFALFLFYAAYKAWMEWVHEEADNGDLSDLPVLVASKKVLKPDPHLDLGHDSELVSEPEFACECEPTLNSELQLQVLNFFGVDLAKSEMS